MRNGREGDGGPVDRLGVISAGPTPRAMACANCGRAIDGSGSDHCAECDVMWEAGVEAAIAAMRTHDAIDVVAAHWGGSGDAMNALANHVRRAVKP